MNHVKPVSRQDAWNFIVARYRDLTPDEQAERKALREEYLADWRRSTIDVLENTYIDHGDGRVTKLPKKRT